MNEIIEMLRSLGFPETRVKKDIRLSAEKLYRESIVRQKKKAESLRGK